MTTHQVGFKLLCPPDRRALSREAKCATRSPIIIFLLLRHGILPGQQSIRQTTSQTWCRRVAPATVRAVQAHARIARLGWRRGFPPCCWPLGRRLRGCRLGLAVGDRGRRGCPRSRCLCLFFDVGCWDPGLTTGVLGKPPSCLESVMRTQKNDEIV